MYAFFHHNSISCFTNERNHCVFDKPIRFRGLFWLFLSTLGACSPHVEPPRTGTDMPAKRMDTGPPPSNGAPPHKHRPSETAAAAAVGRALESGAIEKAQRLASTLGDDLPALLLKARLAILRQDFETAVRIYHQMTDMNDAFERMRIEALADALAKAARPAEAAAQIQGLLRDDLPQQENFRLLKKQGKWLAQSGKNPEAITVYERALKFAPDAVAQDRIRLALSALYVATKQPKLANATLTPVALEGASGALMRQAYNFLEKNEILPNWSPDQHLKRAKRLMKHRNFDAATAALDLAKTAQNSQEVDWLKANILFKRRGHYKEANRAFLEIVKKGGRFADEARFFAARSLSRLDKDAAAIRGYRAFAAQSDRKGRGHYARFLAGRLEFYLGRHKQALQSFEWLVGTGNKPRISRLSDPGDRRDAHFMAGLSAILLKKPQQAVSHLAAASEATRHPTVLKRNQYWQAVALSMQGKGEAATHFYDICQTDATDWYAIMSAKRLAALGPPLGPCEIRPLDFSQTEPVDAGNTALHTALPETDDTPDIAAISEISPLAGLFAEAGLYREAANFLNQAEKSGVKRPAEAWIQHYNALNAPQYAIRRATQALRWPPIPTALPIALAAYPTPYETEVRDVETAHDLPSELLFAIARKESLFDPQAVSWVGAMGMMQMMPRTYEVNRKKAGLPPLKEGELPDPVASIKAAGYEFASLFETFEGSLPLAIMAYNGGAAAVKRWVNRSGGLSLDMFVEKVGFGQTRNYIRRVTQTLVRYRLLQGKPIPTLPEMVEKKGASSDIPK